MELETEIYHINYPFLQGGGEMGALTRAFDWSATPLGSPERWPQSLRIIISVVLSSRFPMFIWWGENLIQFYNDAYRPSLGINGKHPLALGQKGKDCWPEIWEVIFPLIQQVRTTGEPTWSEDQLIPIYRNGKIEDVYWTFGYSAIRGESGIVEGVLVVCNETTQKVESVRKLKQSEKRFQTLIQEATVGIVVLMGEKNVVEIANDAYSKIIGRNTKEIIDRPIFEIVPEAEPYFRHIIDNVRQTGVPYYLFDHPYFVWINSRQKAGFMNLVYQPYREDHGNITGVMVLCQDVTEQVEAKKRVEETELRLRSLVESAPFPIGVYTGREMRIELANQSITDVWGKGNDVVGKLYTELLPELQNQEIFKQLDQVYTTGIPFHTRNQRVDLIVNNKLEPFYFNYSFTPLFDADGNVYGVMNTAAEVTDLNLALQKIEQSEKNFRTMILQAPVAMCILLGPQHVIEVANDFMIELWGKPAKDVISKPVFEALPDARAQGLEALLDNVYQTGEAFSANERPVVLHRKGRIGTVYQNFVYEPYRDGDGTILGVLAVSVDVTEEVLARQKIQDVVAERTKELAEANINLKRSNSDLAQFAYIASHDLQEPVRKVGTFAQMLEAHLGNVDSRSANYINKIKNSSSRMLSLIKGVLAYSELSSISQEFEKVDLQKIMDEILTDFELLIEQKKAVINISGLPQIEAIPLHMSQLFGNLLSNALKFSRPETTPEINITAIEMTKEEVATHPALIQNQKYYRITVADNGIGFDQEYVNKIFSIFQRLHGKNEYEGTGIGLAICQKIVLSHNGEIHAESTINKGSRFIVILPEKQVGYTGSFQGER